MVRSGQMILATALHRHLLDPEWRLATSTSKDLAMHKQVCVATMVSCAFYLFILLSLSLSLSTSTPPSPHHNSHQILSWFADKESDLCPFSLHSLMRVAKKHGYRPGDWFGPSQVAVLIR